MISQKEEFFTLQGQVAKITKELSEIRSGNTTIEEQMRSTVAFGELKKSLQELNHKYS